MLSSGNLAAGQMRPLIAVVDGLSSGALFAPEAHALGLDVAHVQSSSEWNTPNTGSFNPGDYECRFIHNGDPYYITTDSNSVIEVASQLKQLSPIAVFAGAESGVVLADILSERLGLKTNGTTLSHARRNKLLMAQTAERAGVKVAKYLGAKSVDEIFDWMRQNSLPWPIFLKPLTSGGTRGVLACHYEGGVVTAFNSIFGRRNKYGIRDDVVFCQAGLPGPEFAFNTVSADGRHVVTGIWEYGRHLVEGAATVYDWDRLIPYYGEFQPKLVAYGLSILDAFGVQYGPSHIEIKKTPDGPVMVEMATRLYGSRLPALEAAATDRSAVRLSIETFTKENALMGLEQGYELLRHAMVVTLQAQEDGVTMSYRQVPAVKALPGYHSSWFRKEGARLKRPVDADTEMGEVWFLHKDPDVVAASMRTIREWERDGRFVKNPLDEIGDIWSFDVAEAERNWGASRARTDAFWRLYEEKRDFYEGELEFWRLLEPEAKTVLEIGAGTGVVTEGLAQRHGLETLVLVEPELASLPWLADRVLKHRGQVNIKLFPGLMQRFQGPAADLVIFPYDSMSIIGDIDERRGFFKAVAQNLRQEGAFGIHISSRSWNEEFIRQRKDSPKIYDVPATKDSLGFRATYQVVGPITDDHYFKKIDIKFSDGTEEHLLFPVAIVDADEVIEMARENGLELEARYTDFKGTKFTGNKDDVQEHIMVFRKK